MWFRRRRGVVASPPALRVERYVAALAFHSAQLEDRIGQLERRSADGDDAHLELPTHSDLLEVRLHSARVSADLGRLALELRADMAEIKDEADRAAKAAVRAESAARLAQDPERLVELAEELLELADAGDARRRAS